MEMYGIRLAVFRIDPDKMLKNSLAKHLPLLGKDDPLTLKLVRYYHHLLLILMDLWTGPWSFLAVFAGNLSSFTVN